MTADEITSRVADMEEGQKIEFGPVAVERSMRVWWVRLYNSLPTWTTTASEVALIVLRFLQDERSGGMTDGQHMIPYVAKMLLSQARRICVETTLGVNVSISRHEAREFLGHLSRAGVTHVRCQWYHEPRIGWQLVLGN